MPELFSDRMGITKKKKCMFGKDEEPARPRSRYYHGEDTGNWTTISVTYNNSGSSLASASWVYALLEHDD